MSFTDKMWRDFHGQPNSNLDLADEYLAKAGSAKDYETAYTNAKLALEYNPDCLEAECILAMLTTRGNPQKYKREMEKVLAHGERLLEEEGYLPDMAGEFWGILETRPYMRMLGDHMEMLASLEDYEEAIKIGERMLELNPQDNQGIRWNLAHLYVMTLDREGAEKLLGAYPDDKACLFLMGHALLYFRIKEEDKVIELVKQMKSRNRGFDEFFDALCTPAKMDKLRGHDNPYGLPMGGVDELVHEYDHFQFAWKAAKNFERWLKKKGPAL